MTHYAFGSGTLWATPVTDSAGAEIVTPTPVLFGTLQDVSIDVQFESKQLYGQQQFPVAIARGKGRVSGKARFAQISGQMFSSVFFGQSLESGQTSHVYDTTGSVIPETGGTITVTPPNSGQFIEDLGVVSRDGTPLIRVTTAPQAGEYKLSTSSLGLYEFASSDQGKTVFINYQYEASSPDAKKQTIRNLPLGQSPNFRADLFNSHGNKAISVTLYHCIANKLHLATRLDDFMIPEFDFDAFANSEGDVITMGYAK